MAVGVTPRVCRGTTFAWTGRKEKDKIVSVSYRDATRCDGGGAGWTRPGTLDTGYCGPATFETSGGIIITAAVRLSWMHGGLKVVTLHTARMQHGSGRRT